MKQHARTTCVAALAAITVPLLAQQADPNVNATCKPVFADLVEDGSTTDCRPGHPSCFLGQVDGNHGLRGQTYFRSDSGAGGPRTSPGFISYGGEFEYITHRGTLVARETGIVNQALVPSGGAVTAHQQIVSGTGEFSGATGYLFVSGFNTNQHVVTKVSGEICSLR